MGGVLIRKLLRDLWALRGQVGAIALVLGSGLGILIMSLGAIRALEDTRSAFYDRSRFADIFAEARRAPDALVAEVAALPGVRAAESRVQQRVILDLPRVAEPAGGLVQSVPEEDRPRLNDLVLRQGRWLHRAAPDEVLINEAFAEANQMRPGDTLVAVINGHRRTLGIVGIVLSPEFVYSLPPGALMPDDTRHGILWMGRSALAAATGLEGAFNSVVVDLMKGADEPGTIAAIDRLLARYGGTGAYPRREQLSDWFLSGEIDQLAALAVLLPSIFLAVAAFLINIAANRLIALEQPHIGLLKAFGFSNAQVAGHYLMLVGAMAVPGVLLGWMVGAVLGRWITELYAHFFRFPFLIYHVDLGVFALAAAIGLGAASFGALVAVRRAVALRPAEAMIPPAPAVYRRSALFKGVPVGFIDQPTLMILRHLARWPLRAVLTTAGIALSGAVLVLSLHWAPSIDGLLERQFFRESRHDATVTFTEVRPLRVVQELAALPGVLAVEPFRAVPARLRVGPRERREVVIGLLPEPHLYRPLDAADRPLLPPAQGLMVSRALAEILNVGLGQRVTLEVLDGRRPVLDLPVTALADTYIGLGAWMHRDALWAALGEGPSASGVYLTVDAAQAAAIHARLKAMPGVAGVTLRSTAVSTFRDTMAETMMIMVAFYVAFSGLLTFGVVYNTARVSLSERGRELASLRVLGFTQGEVAYILLGELAVLTLAALPLGSVAGWGLAHLLARAMSSELYRIPADVPPSVMGWAAVGVMLAAVASALLVARRLARLDLVSVLKTRE
ncbi:MAG: ABC transporter permease [Rhodospirillaceae bacterium]